MFLAIDIGNTNTVFSILDQSHDCNYFSKNSSSSLEDYSPLYSWRIHTSATRESDEYVAFFTALMAKNNILSSQIKAVGISSVVQCALPRVIRFTKQYFGIEPFIVSAKTQSILDVSQISNKETVGADLISAAVASVLIYNSPSILIDCGTATTFSIVKKCNNEAWQYCGGAISLGIMSTVKAIADMIPALPKLEALDNLVNLYANNTIDAMKAGVYYSQIGAIEYFIQGLKKECFFESGEYKDHKVILTGGLGYLIKDRLSNIIDRYNPYLVEIGIKLCNDYKV